MVATFMLTANLTTPGLLGKKVFWNKDYDVITLSMISPAKVYYVTQII